MASGRKSSSWKSGVFDGIAMSCLGSVAERSGLASEGFLPAGVYLSLAGTRPPSRSSPWRHFIVGSRRFRTTIRAAGVVLRGRPPGDVG
jgi:hypothetical protein